jgi:hypothetical protein
MDNGNADGDNERKYLDSLASHYSGYHNHKETMAHLALAGQLTFVISVLVWKEWPPK